MNSVTTHNHNPGYDPGPRPHGLYCDRDRRGNPRISVTAARKGKSGGGRPLKTLTGHNRNLAYPYLSRILYDHAGRHLAFDAENLAQEYRPISEDAALQMMLLMDAVRSAPNYRQAQALAQAVANMNHCEATWWYSHHTNRSRPRRVLQALALMHA